MPLGVVTRRQFAHAPEDGARRGDDVMEEVIVNGLRVMLWRGAGSGRAAVGARGEDEAVSRCSMAEGMDAHAVDREQGSASCAVQNGQCVFTVQVAERVMTVFAVQGSDGGRVAPVPHAQRRLAMPVGVSDAGD